MYTRERSVLNLEIVKKAWKCRTILNISTAKKHANTDENEREKKQKEERNKSDNKSDKKNENKTSCENKKNENSPEFK